MPAALRSALPATGDWMNQLPARIRRFGRWWLGQLLAMLPPGWRHWSALHPDELRLLLNEDSIEVTVTSAGGQRAIALFEGRARATAILPLRTFLRHKITERTRVSLTLPRYKCLVCTLSLPAAAKDNLRQVLHYEMDRHTPFTGDQVWFDYRVIATSAEQIGLTLYAAPRDTIDQALDLARQLGLRPYAIGVDEPGPLPSGMAPLNLLPPAARPARFSRRQALDAGLAGVVALLLAAVIVIPFWHQGRHIERLSLELREARAAAEAAFAVRDRRDTLLATLDRIRAQRHATPPVLRTLDELSARLPDDTWLHRVEIKGGSLQLQGESGAAAALIRILEDSPLLEHVNFRSPVTQDARTGRENFQITAGLKSGARP